MGRKGNKVKLSGKLSIALLKQQSLEKSTKLQKEKELKQIQLKKDSIKNKNKPKNPELIKEKQSYIPFNENDYVLFVGEGDFSFSLSAIQSGYLKPERIIATSFDSFEEGKLKYKNFENNVSELKAKGVKVIHEVDVTNLIKSLKLTSNFKKNKFKNKEILGTDKLNLIMFNFPHTGKGIKDINRNIAIHQKLIVDYYKNCFELFHLLKMNRNYNISQSTTHSSIANSGYGIIDNLNKKNSSKNVENIDRIALSLFDGEPYNSWQIKRLAKESIGYKVERSGSLNWNDFPNYEHRRTNSMMDTTKASAERDAKIYVFDKFIKLDDKKKKVDSDDED
ncbi:hypothetical protein CANARDRAFT_204996 [[Candida] arabinofermentans NRRL YB-2248]|uniref:25S rRNA (uridine-N(3))-methyltransferase BMT5-like domain-containing protein n=1 Tax=[Candida] arabinofermentans NRRL YB-2248 TaxID=983967 RepID=A0A1E4SSQ3_9ASCO|nr:hypothetical protein CANARDRAFT_204996 [[Candida] arabinofermentans NRRL YB-2248]